MKKFSKFLSMVLVLCALITLLPTMNIEAEAATNFDVWSDLNGRTLENATEFADYLKSIVGLRFSSSTSGRCQAFVYQAFDNCFNVGNSAPSCCANTACKNYRISQAMENIPLGASVYFSAKNGPCSVCSAQVGHVGIYVGDGQIVHCAGKDVNGVYEKNHIQLDPISKITDNWGYSYEGWGWQGGFAVPNCDHSASTLGFEKYGYCTNCGGVNSNKVSARNSSKTYQLTLDIMSRTAPYSAALNAEQMYTGETFVALGEYENLIYNDNANHVWLRFEKNGRTCFVNTNSVTEIKAVSTLAVSDTKMPEGHFDSIRKFGLRGKFSSNYDITRILALVYDGNGKHILNYDVSPNKKSYNIQTEGLNDAFAFGKLPDGSYTYSVTAYDASGAEKNVSSTFSIGAVVNSAQAPVVTPTPTPAPAPTYLPVYEAPVLTPVPTQAPVYEAPVITPAPTQAPVYQAPAAPTYTPPQVVVSNSNVTIDLAYNNSFLVQLAITGDAPAGCYFNLSAAGPFVCEWNDNYSFTIVANGVGSANLDVLLCDAYGQVIASNTIYVNVVNSREEFIFDNPQIYSSYPEIPQEPVYQAPAASTLSIYGTDQPSGYFDTLRNYGLRGVISSNYDITRVLAYVFDAYGNAVLSYDTAPYRKSYDIQYDGLNNAFSFGTLPSGSYTYSVTAYDASGAEKSITSYFEIGGSAATSASADIPIYALEYYMTVNVGAGSTLRFCSYVSVADQYEIASIPNGASVYVYGTTQYQYEDRTWAKINYNGVDGWVNYKWLS